MKIEVNFKFQAKIKGTLHIFAFLSFLVFAITFCLEKQSQVIQQLLHLFCFSTDSEEPHESISQRSHAQDTFVSSLFKQICLLFQWDKKKTQCWFLSLRSHFYEFSMNHRGMKTTHQLLCHHLILSIEEKLALFENFSYELARRKFRRLLT